MTTSRELWLLIADSEHVRLLHGTGTRHDHLHLDEVAALKTTFAAGQHQRPARMGPAGRSGEYSHEREEKLAHFAREAATWIGQELTARKIPVCQLFAPTHFLGALRRELPKDLAGRLREHDGELAAFSLADVARHPRVVELLPA